MGKKAEGGIFIIESEEGKVWGRRGLLVKYNAIRILPTKQSFSAGEQIIAIWNSVVIWGDM